MGKNTIVRRKLVMIGDGASGKTCMLIAFVDGTFSQQYIPTIFESTVADVQLDSHKVQLALWDTAGQEEYDRLRTLSYPDSNVILICFAIDNPDSLENVADKWVVEANRYCQGAAYMLIGTKSDLRTNPDTLQRLNKRQQSPTSAQTGKVYAQKINAVKYLECSAKTGDGIQTVFEEATRVSLRAGKRHRACIIL